MTAWNGTNLNNVSDHLLSALVKYKFRRISVSIDGCSERTYRIYRRNGNFNNVIRNIERINYYKEKYNSKLPDLIWQFIIFGHNEHELPKAKAMAKKMKMSFRVKLNHNPDYSPVKDRAFVRKHAGIAIVSRDDFEKAKKRPYIWPCIQLWDSPQINWDGKLLGCCVNNYGHFGDVFKSGLRECLNSERYIYAKKMVLGLVPPRPDIPCVKCNVYHRHAKGDRGGS